MKKSSLLLKKIVIRSGMFNSYVDFIGRELECRISKNSGYSIRAFARDMNCSYQSLSAVLAGKQGISPATANKLLPHLKMNDLECRLFMALVIHKHHRSFKQRAKAGALADSLRQELKIKVYDSEHYQLIANWIHSAILVLLNVDSFRPDAIWIAQRLGISEADAAAAWGRLIEAELIQKNDSGRWQQKNSRQSFHSATLSHAQIEVYGQLNRLAQEKLTSIPVPFRDVSNIFVSINADDYEHVVRRVRAFRRELMEEIIQRGGSCDRVYSLLFQFFPITQVDAL